MPLPSASALERAMACVASAVLPRTESASEPAREGTALHAFFAKARKLGREAALELVPAEYRQRAETVDFESLPPEGAEWLAEAALTYDVETEGVRFLGLDRDRAYGPLAPSELPMSIDLVGLFDGGAFVGDFKTGHGRVTSACRNWQLRVGALAVARWKGLDSARVAIIRVPEDGAPRYDVAELDALELFAAAQDLRAIRERILDAEATLEMDGPTAVKATVGEHCRYCPSRLHCPAQTALVRRMAGEPEALAQELRALLTPETAAKAYERVRVFEALLKQVKGALYEYALMEPIRLSDGTLFGKVTTEREELDAAVVREVLAGLHGPAVAEAACSFDTSKAAVERALRPVYEREKQAGRKLYLKTLVSDALEAVRERGGVAAKSRTEVKEYREEASQ